MADALTRPGHRTSRREASHLRRAAYLLRPPIDEKELGGRPQGPPRMGYAPATPVEASVSQSIVGKRLGDHG